MVHEHQRWDRDTYLEFRCKNLAGMQGIVKKYMKDKQVSEDAAWEALCTDDNEAYEYDAPSIDYIKGNGLDAATKPHLDGEDGFDMNSST